MNLTKDVSFKPEKILILGFPFFVLITTLFYPLVKIVYNKELVFESISNLREWHSHGYLVGLGIILVLFLGIIIHELIHGLVWSAYCENGFRSIQFGILWKQLLPYCHCTEALRVHQYAKGVIAPLLTLGILPTLIALFTKSFFLLLFGYVFTSAAFGDIFIWCHLLGEKPNANIQDHKSKVGYTIIE
jgi:hypothetical protein